MAYEFNRNIQDSAYTSTVAVTQAGANTATFDLEQVIGGDVEKVVFELSAPAVSGISDTKVLTYTLKDSPDGTTFTTLDPAIATTQTGASSAGVAAKTVRFRLPPITKRYVRIEQTATASAGTFASQTMVAKLLF
jgi:hypothetical protein